MTPRINLPTVPRATRLAPIVCAEPLAITWGSDTDQGSRPAFFVHGLPQKPPVFAPLAGCLPLHGVRPIAPYLYGHLYKCPEDYHPAQLVDNVLAVADRFELERFEVVGVGLGAAVGWLLAGLHPERVSGLACIQLLHPVAAAAKDMPLQPNDLQLRKARVRQLFIEQELPPHVLDPYVKRMSAPGAYEAALAVHALQADELPWLNVPVLLVANEGDDLAAVHRIQQRVAPGLAQVALLQQGTRFPLEDASPELLPLVLRHLLRH